MTIRLWRGYWITLLLGVLLVPALAMAVEFKNIGAQAAILYDAPSSRGQKIFVAPRGMPVEVVVNYGAWSKVRDVSGDLSWVETKQLAERKNVVVRALSAKVYLAPDESSSVVFTADKGVLLELVDSKGADGWVKVKHRDGASGYVALSDVFGV